MVDNKILSITSDVLAQEVSGEMVLLDLNNEQYLGLNEVGARVWQLLEKISDMKTIYETLLSEYDVESSVLENDLNQLVADMIEAGVVTVDKNK